MQHSSLAESLVLKQPLPVLAQTQLPAVEVTWETGRLFEQNAVFIMNMTMQSEEVCESLRVDKASM